MNSKLYLRAFEYEDLPFINLLRNEDELYKYTCGNKFYISSERDIKWIEDKIFNNRDQLYLMLCTKGENTPIGYVAATNIDYLNRKAQYGGIVIAREHAGKGYGTEASQLLLRHIFEELGMNMMYGFWREDHLASLRMAEKIGFKRDGLVRDYVFKQNGFHNAYIYSILKSEYNSMYVLN
ncbi:GNAT family N-acetyltransferase [Sutcliffiella deserti]|uniref:GNAT family N-acetyltransferase n=1 Tax=Sutcliffiella deserti TaxID=2875501 RepID=UPI001CBE1E58|nr:GNAT family protein [Sutcliffiella deserti]